MGIITQERWQQAQEAERKFHNESFDEGYAHYMKSYQQYFKYLGIDPNTFSSNKIVEIGPANFPALAYYRNNNVGSIIIEPLPSEYLKRFGIPIKTEPAEYCEYEADEVWLFNVLQHVLDPNLIVERAKKQAKVIRFFEPTNYGVDECHPHNLTMEMFNDWFGACVKYYPKNDTAVNFHRWECAYGVWEKVDDLDKSS